MAAPRDLTNQRFTSLVALSRAENDKHGKARWLCRCDCGTEKVIGAGPLLKGDTVSCGCHRAKLNKTRAIKREEKRRETNSLKNKRFGALIVVDRAPNDSGHRSRWWVKCDCGSDLKIVLDQSLRSGHTQSCGCRIGGLTHGQAGKEDSKEYRAWVAMRDRCLNPNFIGWKNYGGRGIAVCDRWRDSFEAFFEDMGPAPSPEHSLDRIDNDKGYSPENCRWASQRQQHVNRSDNRRVTIDGVEKTLIEWSEISGVKYHTISKRLLKYGWDPKRAVFEPARGKS